MTTRDKIFHSLVCRGFGGPEAREVANQAINAITIVSASHSPEYQISWDRPAHEYPDILFNVWDVTVRETALNWLNEHRPEAWYKPIFMKQIDQEKFLNSQTS